MEVQIASLCDAAADYNGKLSLLGAFDTILVSQLPAVHPHCSVGIRIVFTDEDTGEHHLRLAMIDADGKNLLPKVEARLNIRMAENMFFATHNVVFNFQGLQFPKVGPYSIDISMDDKIIARIPLQILRVQNPGAPPAAA